jgi:hypothetical protein
MTKPSPNIFIATPMYGGVCHAGYTEGMLFLNKTFLERGWGFTYRYTSNESLINRARNNLVHHFLTREIECTHLLFIDADIVGFGGEDVCRMVDFDVDIIAGVYPMKYIDPIAVKENVLKEEEEILNDVSPLVFNDNKAIDKGSIKQVENAGTGFMLIKREVFEKIKSIVPVYINNSMGYEGETTFCFFDTSIDRDSRILLSEDYHFCKLWNSVGGKIHIDLQTKLKHAGTYIFD